MFILGKTSCTLQALAIAGISLNTVRPSAARSWQTTLAYVNDENDKATDWEGEVQAYEPGKLLAIRKGPQQEVKLDLTKTDTTYFIAPGVVEGREVIISDKNWQMGGMKSRLGSKTSMDSKSPVRRHVSMSRIPFAIFQ